MVATKDRDRERGGGGERGGGREEEEEEEVYNRGDIHRDSLSPCT
jgi:hypothetical protein